MRLKSPQPFICVSHAGNDVPGAAVFFFPIIEHRKTTSGEGRCWCGGTWGQALPCKLWCGLLAWPWVDMGDGQGHGMSLEPLVQDVPAIQDCPEGFTGRLQFWIPGESMWRETNIPSLPLE